MRLLAVCLTGCVVSAPILPQRAELVIAAPPAVLTLAAADSTGALAVTGRVSGGADVAATVVFYVDGEALASSAERTLAFRWPLPANEASVTHSLAFVGVDALGRELPGSAAFAVDLRTTIRVTCDSGAPRVGDVMACHADAPVSWSIEPMTAGVVSADGVVTVTADGRFRVIARSVTVAEAQGDVSLVALGSR